MNIYSHTYSVILDNMDLNGYRLKPIAAIMYMQDAFARMCATKKMAAYDLFPKKLYWVIEELNLECTAPLPFWSEDIRVEIWISELSIFKIYTDFRLYSKETLVAQGNGCWFILDQGTHHPVKTDIVAEKFSVVDDLVLGKHKRFAIEKPLETTASIDHTCNLSDIDFNGHVNNKSYITVAEASISESFRKTHVLKGLNIRFCRETFLGDTLHCDTYATARENTWIHKLAKDGTLMCEIQTVWEERHEEETILESDLEIKKISQENGR